MPQGRKESLTCSSMWYVFWQLKKYKTAEQPSYQCFVIIINNVIIICIITVTLFQLNRSISTVRMFLFEEGIWIPFVLFSSVTKSFRVENLRK